ncbi:MAG: NADPH:quinone reductase and related Zn-dependent oxidoreductase-like protein [Microbacteriaceae bacterium]|nr:NADPH:quinone reductase and related Zn-dependent oxidoreductase-like protein [Microbacteriaceae bacterium]
MTGSLVDRYVAATLRRIPERQRPEIERELRAAIADDVDARVDQGAPEADAEHAALEALGDPYRLAAGYTNRPLTLIGPEFYPNYVRTLRLLGWTVLPCVVLVGVVVSAAQGKGVSASIFGPIGLGVQVAIYIAFTITLLFVLAERFSGQGAKGEETRSAFRWTVEQLPPEPETHLGSSAWGEFLTQVIGALIVAALLVFDRFSPVVKNSAGDTVSVLDPGLWTLWVPVFFVLLALSVVLAFVVFRLRRWTVGTAIAGSLLGLVSSGALIVMVLTTPVVNPALTDAAAVRPGSWVWVVASVVIAVVYVVSTVRDWRQRTAQPR